MQIPWDYNSRKSLILSDTMFAQFVLSRALLKTSFTMWKQFNKLPQSAIFKYVFVFNWHTVIEPIYGLQCDIALDVHSV